MQTHLTRLNGRILLAIFALSMPGCASIVAVPSAAQHDAPMTVDAADALRIRSGDILKLTVYGDETMSGEFPVDQSGMVNIPLAGALKAQGLTTMDLQTAIVSALKRGGYMTDAAVTAAVLTPRPFYVLGEVKLAGNYPYQPSMTAMQAIASAGGYTPRAAQNRILIDRKVEGGTVRLNARETTPILPGDSIIVRERIF